MCRPRGVFSDEEIEALHIRVHKTRRRPQPASLREVVRMIGRLGGHLGRKGDGEPGVTVLWRGWSELYETIDSTARLQTIPGPDSTRADRCSTADAILKLAEIELIRELIAHVPGH